MSVSARLIPPDIAIFKAMSFAIVTVTNDPITNDKAKTNASVENRRERIMDAISQRTQKKSIYKFDVMFSHLSVRLN